jgi:hypothetical protein
MCQQVPDQHALQVLRVGEKARNRRLQRQFALLQRKQGKRRRADGLGQRREVVHRAGAGGVVAFGVGLTECALILHAPAQQHGAHRAGEYLLLNRFLNHALYG